MHHEGKTKMSKETTHTKLLYLLTKYQYNIKYLTIDFLAKEKFYFDVNME